MRKGTKYADLQVSHHFIPVVIEASGVFGEEALSFIRELHGMPLASEDGRAPVTSLPATEGCCSHAKGEHSRRDGDVHEN